MSPHPGGPPMAEITADRCPTCGDDRPAGSPRGLCPRCQSAGALNDASTPPPDTTTSGWVAPDTSAPEPASSSTRIPPADVPATTAPIPSPGPTDGPAPADRPLRYV